MIKKQMLGSELRRLDGIFNKIIPMTFAPVHVKLLRKRTFLLGWKCLDIVKKWM